MKEISLEVQKEIQIKGLLYLKEVCEKNNIPYFLANGSLLGAVKYGGYIPWDDDIDVYLKRNDYLKLLKVMEKEKNEYKLLTAYNTKDYYYPYAKLVNTKTKVYENAKDIKDYGVFIDVFPLDYFDDVKRYERIRFLRNLASKRMKIQNYIQKSNLKNHDNEKISHEKLKNFVYTVFSFITMPFGYNFYARHLDKVSSRRKRGRYIGIIYKNPPKIFEASLFDEMGEYTFEKHTFTSVKDYDKYLSNLYGDYKKELPDDKKYSHHQIKAYWR